MKKVSLIILLFTLSRLYAQQSLDIVKTYYDPFTKTKLKEVYTVIHNTPTLQGLYKLYSEYGEILMENNFTNGKFNGTTKTFFTSEGIGTYGNPKESVGKVSQLQTYKNGVLDGQTIDNKYPADKNEPNKTVTTYANGKAIKTEEFYSNGKKASSSVSDGPNVSWAINGIKTAECNAINGLYEGDYTEWFSSSKLKTKGNFTNDKKSGYWVTYFENGTKQTEIDFGENENPNSVKGYSADGKLILNRTTKDKLNFQTTNYDSISGKLLSETQEISGFDGWQAHFYKKGTETFYYSSGNKKIINNYIAKLESSYDKGNHYEEILKSHQEWYENGKLKKEVVYDEYKNTLSEKNYDEAGVPDDATKRKTAADVATDLSNKAIANSKETILKEQNENAAAEIEYNNNLEIISKKREEVCKLYEVKEKPLDTYHEMMKRNESKTIINIIELNSFTVKQKKNLYYAFVRLYNKINYKNSGSFKEKNTNSKQTILLLNKMIELHPKDTNSLEKQLKNEENTEKIKSLIGL